jgi:hypothetical protein
LLEPSAPGWSGQLEHLELLTAEIESGETSSVSVDDPTFSLGFSSPKLSLDPGGELWVGTVQSWDFPPTIVGNLIDPLSGETMERIFGPSCGRLESYDLLAFQGVGAMLVDCAPGGGVARTAMTLGRGSFRTDQVLLENQSVELPSRLAFDGNDLAVAIWETGQRAPALRFFSRDGQPHSAGAIRLPVPADLDPAARPLTLKVAGIPGGAGGFVPDTAAWGVVYAYAGPRGPRAFFARLGACGTALPR